MHFTFMAEGRPYTQSALYCSSAAAGSWQRSNDCSNEHQPAE